MARRTDLDILAEARKLIASPHRWCRYELVDARGAHCAIGAVVAAKLNKPHDSSVDGWKYRSKVEPLLETLAAHLPKKDVAVGKAAWANVALYNNSHSHKQVLRLFDKAMAATTSGK